MKFLASIALMVALSSPALACGVDGGGDGDAALMRPESHEDLKILAELDPITVSKPFGLNLTLCGDSGGEIPVTIKADAWMPRHQHGMNYEPTITPTSPGKFTVSNMVFHMPGLWQLRVSVRTGDTAKSATYLLDIEVR